MKPFFKLAVTPLLLFLFSCEEITEPGNVEQDFYFKVYGNFHDDYLTHFELGNDGTYAFVGYSTEKTIEGANTIYNTSLWPFFYKAAENGNVVSTFYTNESFIGVRFFHAKYVNNDIYVTAGSLPQNDTIELALLRFKQDTQLPDTLYSKKLRAAEFTHSEIVVYDDQSIMLYTQIVKPDNKGNLQTHIVIDDLEGDIKSFDLGYTTLDKIKVKYLGNEHVIIGTTVPAQKDAPTSSKSNIRLISLIKNDRTWDESFYDSTRIESCVDLHYDNTNSKIIAVGNFVNSAGNYGLIKIQVLLSNGELDNMKAISYPGFGEGQTTCNSFTLNTKGNYVFTGSHTYSAENSDLFFLETTPDLAIVSNNQEANLFGSNNQKPGNNKGLFVNYSNATGSYFVAGQIMAISNFDIALFKLNEEGIWGK